MKVRFFKMLAQINRLMLPKYYKRDLRALRSWEKAIVGYKMWVVKKILP